MKYMTIQGEIYHTIELSCDFGNLNGFPLKLGEGGRLGKGGHMENHEHTQIRIGLSFWMYWEPYKANEFYKIQE